MTVALTVTTALTSSDSITVDASRLAPGMTFSSNTSD